MNQTKNLNYTSTIKKKRYPVIEGKNSIDIELTNRFQREWDKMCARVSFTEWCGKIFYETIGDINDITNFRIKLRAFVPLTIDDPHHTGFDIEESDLAHNILTDFRKKNAILALECKEGFIHSHHGMDTFFSGEDTQELHDSVELYDMYLSLIVNNAGTLCAKVARLINLENLNFNIPNQIGERSIVTLNNLHPKSAFSTVFMYTNDCTFTFEPTPMDDFSNYIKLLIKEKTEKDAIKPVKYFSPLTNINLVKKDKNEQFLSLLLSSGEHNHDITLGLIEIDDWFKLSSFNVTNASALLMDDFEFNFKAFKEELELQISDKILINKCITILKNNKTYLTVNKMCIDAFEKLLKQIK